MWFVDIRKWDANDVIEFVRHRGYPVALEELFHKQKVDGRGLLRIVTNTTLLSSLGLHPLRAQGLIDDVKDYKSSGNNN